MHRILNIKKHSEPVHIPFHRCVTVYLEIDYLTLNMCHFQFCNNCAFS